MLLLFWVNRFKLIDWLFKHLNYLKKSNKGNLKQKQQIGDNLNKDLLVGYANSVVDLDNDYSPGLLSIVKFKK